MKLRSAKRFVIATLNLKIKIPSVYNLIDETDKKSHHYSIGKLLLDRANDKKSSEEIYAIIHQLNIGKSLLSNEEINSFLDLNLKAGTKAKTSTAGTAAVHFLKQGMALLPNNSWDSHYQTTLVYYLELTEAEYHGRNFKEADRLFDVILTKVTSSVDSPSL